MRESNIAIVRMRVCVSCSTYLASRHFNGNDRSAVQWLKIPHIFELQPPQRMAQSNGIPKLKGSVCNCRIFNHFIV